MSYLHKFIDCTKMIQTVVYAKVNAGDNIYDLITFSCFSIHIVSRSEFFTTQIMFHFYNKCRRITYGNLEIFKLKISTLAQFTILVQSDRFIKKKSFDLFANLYIYKLRKSSGRWLNLILTTARVTRSNVVIDDRRLQRSLPSMTGTNGAYKIRFRLSGSAKWFIMPSSVHRE